MQSFLFYFLSAVILIFSLLTVTTKRILRAAVYLLFVLVSTAGIYFLFNYNFLAAVQLTLYAGGIIVLIIFSIMLTGGIGELLGSPPLGKVLLTALAGACGAVLCIGAFIQYGTFPVHGSVQQNNIGSIGEALMNYGKDGYILPFEVISILLLAVIVGAIVIAKRT